MYDWTTAGTLALGCVAALYIGRRAFGSRTSHPLPPGPLGLPWVGNVIGLDTYAPWKTYAEWARTYGDIFYTQLLGKDIIIINSEKIAKDLLGNRSRNYSDRPPLVAVEMIGLDFHSGLLRYGDRWRLHRRFFNQMFGHDAVLRFVSLHHRKACHFLHQLFDTPEKLNDHVFEYATSVALNSAYDYDPASRKDEFVEIMANDLEIVVPALRADVAVMLSAFPLLFRLPSWLPGMSIKTQITKARTLSKQFLERPFEYSIQKAPGDSAAPSMVHDALRDMLKKEVAPEESWMQTLKEASGTVFVGASPTSNSVLMTFFLMMVLNPAVQDKAQKQIDAVVGTTRLPIMEDRPLLPYIDAILWEILRYNPVLPLSLPHAAVDDDVFAGFHIPKGAIFLTNLWSIAHDESRYPKPHTFIPERFLNDDGSLKPNEIEHIVFGFGRRICPGKHFADMSVWGVIVKVLAVFKILKPLDKKGAEIPVEPKFSTGFATGPLPFGYRIIPRFPEMDAEKLEQLIGASTA